MLLCGVGRHPVVDIAPHLVGADIERVRREVTSTHPKPVIIDPLCLAARGAQSFNMFDMGGHLERIQHICQEFGSSLLITHHWNLTGKGTGARRMAGAGPEAWGRVLISLAVEKETVEPVTKASIATLSLEFQGDELGRQFARVRRRVWTDDPQDLGSALHYEITRLDADSARVSDVSNRLRPAARVVKEVLDEARSDLSVDAIRKDLAARGLRYERRTVQDALQKLVTSGDAMKLEDCTTGKPGRWRTTHALVDGDDVE